MIPNTNQAWQLRINLKPNNISYFHINSIIHSGLIINYCSPPRQRKAIYSEDEQWKKIVELGRFVLSQPTFEPTKHFYFFFRLMQNALIGGKWKSFKSSKIFHMKTYMSYTFSGSLSGKSRLSLARSLVNLDSLWLYFSGKSRLSLSGKSRLSLAALFL